MLDFFSIATKGGLVLWSKAYGPAQSSPINNLIQDILIEERSSTQIYLKDNYAIKWTFVNDLDLIFIVRHALLAYYCKYLYLQSTDKSSFPVDKPLIMK